MKFHFFALAAQDTELSGGDRIFVELAKRWSKKFPVTIHTWKDGGQKLARQKLGIFNSKLSTFITNKNYKSLKLDIIKITPWCNFGFVVCYFARIIKGILLGLTLRLSTKYQSSIILYSASEFWMDSFPALILKLRFPNVKWVAAWYQTAPNPLKGYKEKGIRASSYTLSAVLYWLAQLPIKPLISRYANFVLVNNEEEKKQFPNHAKSGRVLVVLGAVPLEEIRKYVRDTRYEIRDTKKYDAVFQGRFHPQKGVVELIDIWKEVVKKIPQARLAMIGNGPLMQEVVSRIAYHSLQRNIRLFGYLEDGPKKYYIFSKSQTVVHPSFYDSGGMASAEAMAFGLPCVGFNLASYKSYYPKGMVKVPIGEKNAFANAILDLLEDKEKRDKIGREARQMIESYWSWDKRAEGILYKIL